MVGLKRAEPYSLNAIGFTAYFDGIYHIEIFAFSVGRKIYSYKHNLFYSVKSKQLCLFFQVFGCFASYSASRGRNDAVRTESVTAVLDFYKGSYSLVKTADGAFLKNVAFFVLVDFHYPVVINVVFVYQVKYVVVVLV